MCSKLLFLIKVDEDISTHATYHSGIKLTFKWYLMDQPDGNVLQFQAGGLDLIPLLQEEKGICVCTCMCVSTLYVHVYACNVCACMCVGMHTCVHSGRKWQAKDETIYLKKSFILLGKNVWFLSLQRKGKQKWKEELTWWRCKNTWIGSEEKELL